MARRNGKLNHTRKRSPLPRRRRLMCETLERRIVLSATIGNNIAVGDQMQNYRLAIAATAQYTAFHGGQAQAFAEIEDVVSQLNEIFEEELSIHLDLVSNTNTVFTDSSTDGYTNGSVTAMIDQNTPILDGVFTSGGYDIGHVFGTGTEGGLAGLGVVNSASRKGAGVSTVSEPYTHDPDWIKLVAHEIGHQFAADHTFNASVVVGGGEAREGDNAYEPASGSTLMSYAGISNQGDNIQGFVDPYFHAVSFEQVQTFTGGAGSPNSLSATGNSPPTISGGSDFTIPVATPFELTAIGSDADSDTRLTYTWEQLDRGGVQGLPVTDDGSRPLFRSVKPSDDPNRVFPRLSDLVAGVDTNAIGEALPTTTRSLNFRATVRDGDGGVNSDDVLVSVVDTGSAFVVTSPNGGEAITGGTSATITWDVAGTTGNGINTAMVGIDLSLDGGLTYPVSLGTVDNNGSHTVQIPNLSATEARVRVRGDGNVFFDISDSNFTINAASGAVGFTITETDASTIVGEQGLVGGQVVDSYTIQRNTATPGTTNVSVNAGAQIEVSLDGTAFFSSVSVPLTGVAAQTIHVRGVDDNRFEGVHYDLITHSVTSSSDASYAGVMVPPVAVSIGDDELQPLIGVDLDETGQSPTNWTRASAQFGDSYTNLTREDGFVTGVGLTIGIGGGAVLDSTVPAEVPLHTPSLDSIDGLHIASDSFELTWTGLAAGTDYNLYLMTTEDFSNVYMQQVQITGGIGDPLPFTQNTTEIGNSLLVNSGFADKDEPLEANRVVAQADANGEIRILVSDISSGGLNDTTIAAAAIQEISSDSVGFTLVQSGDSTTVKEDGTQDTFDVVLTSPPNGNVVINVVSGDTDEATVSTGTLTFDNSDWDTPQTVTVTGVDDSLLDGTQTSLATLSIDPAQTTDDRFDSVAARTVTVLTEDDDVIPLIGVDFGSGGTGSPTNWTQITDTFGSTTNDLINEGGVATLVDLQVTVSGGASVATTPSPANLPDHTPSLAGIDGARFSVESIVLTWSDLVPGTEYDLWLFLAENYANVAQQQVVITGGGTNPAPFNMDNVSAASNTLFVNDLIASPARTLSDDAVRATADGSGNIVVAVTRIGGSQVWLNGAAIQEVPSVNADLSVSTHGNESGPVDIVFTVTLDSPNSTGSPITFDFDDLGTGTATSGSDYDAIAPSATISVPNGSSTGTFTVSVTDDGEVELTETVVGQISNASLAAVSIGTASATANILDNDVVSETSVGLDGSNDLLIQDVNGGDTDDTLTLSVNGGSVRVHDPNQPLLAGTGAMQIDANTVEAPIASITGANGVVIDTLGGDDTLTVDFSGGEFSMPIVFNGGPQNTAPDGDTLVLTGGGAFSDATFHYFNEHDGSIDVTDTGTSTITYTGLEPITSSITVADLTLNFSAIGEWITVSDAGGGQTTVDSNVGGETTTFSHPTGTLTINAGDSGNDWVNIDSLAANYPASVSINGGSGNDTVNVDGPVSLDNADFLVDADTIVIGQSVATGGGDVTLQATGDITLEDAVTTGGGAYAAHADSDSDGSGAMVLSPSVMGAFSSQDQKLTPLDGGSGDRFGGSISVSGNFAIVGSILDNASAIDSGSAYVFVYDGTNWIQHQKLTPSDAAAGDKFGVSVAIDGDTAVIGAFDNDALGSNSGAAYVFKNIAGTWTEQQKLSASDGDVDDRFGTKVAISGDTIIAAAKDNDDHGYSSGSVYVFTSSGGVWTEQQELHASDAAAFHSFGNDLAIDGDTVVVGAPGSGTNTSGAAYVFTRTANVWTQQQKLEGTDPANADNFGRVAIDGDTIAVGAFRDDDNVNNSGSVYLFTRSGSTWTQQQKVTASDGASGDEFGWFVSIEDDTLLVSAYGDVYFGSFAGAAYVFENDAGTWTETAKLVSNDLASGDRFGYSVALDGGTAFVGAIEDDDNGNASGSAYVFQSSVPVAGGSISTAGGDIGLTAATIDLQGQVAGAGTLTLAPSVPSSTIGLGGGAGTLNLDDAELAQLVDGFSLITIGDVTAGTGVIDLDTVTLNDPLLLAGDSVGDTDAGIDLTGPSVHFLARIAPGQSPGILSIVGDATIGAGETFEVEIGGTSPGTASTDHDQLSVLGAVTIQSGVNLSVEAHDGYVPTVGDSFMIVERSGGSGAFSGLPQGTVLPAFLGNTDVNGIISYQGGDGDDVVIDLVSNDFVVDTLDDTADASPGDGLAEDSAGNTSLRAAIEEGNAIAGHQNIEFDSALISAGAAVIALGGTQLPEIIDDLTINGPGASGLTISGGNVSRVLEIGSGVVATVFGLTIADGNGVGGGGIHNDGTLVISDSVITANVSTTSGGGVYNAGVLTVTGTSIAENDSLSSSGGGGVYNIGTATIDSTTVRDNYASNQGGGIMNVSAITIVNSTISGNEADFHGGGLSQSVYSNTQTLLRNSTIANNRSDADGDGSGDGGGIYTNSSLVTLFNTIVADNVVGSGASSSDLGGVDIQSASTYNVIANASTAGGLTDGTNGNQVGVDPLLGPLQDNGGPTLTHALPALSPAIDAGSNSEALNAQGVSLLFDQRGMQRLFDGNEDSVATVDVGAVENPEVNTPSGINLTETAVNENLDTSSADLLFAELSAVDSDASDTHAFELISGDGDTDNHRFKIVGDQLLLNQGETLDHETHASYSVRLQVTDSSGLTFAKSVTLGVNDLIELTKTSITIGARKIDGGVADQRSRVDTVAIEFDSVVTIDPGAFIVIKRGTGGEQVQVAFTTEVSPEGNTIAKLTFSGSSVEHGSLVDGNYELRVLSSKIINADGFRLDANTDGADSMGEEFVLGQTEADHFYRFFGDKTGDRVVGIPDFGGFRASFGKREGEQGFDPAYDFNGDGVVGIPDFGPYRARFGKSLPFE